MFSYILRRLVMTIPVMTFVSLFVFLLLDLAPGDPAALLAGEDATPATIAEIRNNLGLDAPIALRYLNWISLVLQGDFGASMYTGQPVLTMIGQRFVPTFSLMALTILISVVIAVPAGVLAAWKHNKWQDKAMMLFAVLAFSIPSFVVGYLLAYTFGLKLKWLAVQGYTPLDQGVIASVKSLILPALALASVYIALIARITRAAVIETMSQDYIRTARAKGVGNMTLLFRHALKNAAIPIVTVIGAGVAILISGTVVIETVFSIPGLGRLIVDAVLRRDYTIIQGTILIFAMLYVLVNLSVDILYRVFDPRVKY